MHKTRASIFQPVSDVCSLAGQEKRGGKHRPGPRTACAHSQGHGDGSWWGLICGLRVLQVRPCQSCEPEARFCLCTRGLRPRTPVSAESISLFSPEWVFLLHELRVCGAARVLAMAVSLCLVWTPSLYLFLFLLHWVQIHIQTSFWNEACCDHSAKRPSSSVFFRGVSFLSPTPAGLPRRPRCTGVAEMHADCPRAVCGAASHLPRVASVLQTRHLDGTQTSRLPSHT